MTSQRADGHATGSVGLGSIVCTPLAVEHAAVRGGLPAADVRRTGAGPARSARAATSMRAEQRAILVAGVGGALAEKIAAGDVVVATEVRTAQHRFPVASAPMLATALRRAGLTVHLGPIFSNDRVVHGPERQRLAATGALAVDMESATLAPATAPFAAVRAIVDTPSDPLLRPGTVLRGLTALRSLRNCGPAIAEWQAALADREVILASPRSFCAGVGRAIDIVERSIEKHGAPVYVRRQIVHNVHVVSELEQRGAIFVEEVDEVPRGSLLVLAAHGVSPQVRADAAARGLTVIDATCPLVAKVHAEVRRYAGHGDTVFLIGHGDHEEVVGTRGEAPANVVVVPDAAAAAQVQVPDPERVAYVMQTTLAVDEAADVADVLRARFPRLSAPAHSDICYATTNRQQSVRAVAAEADLMLVVGSKNSSNSQRLVEVSQRQGVEAHLVEDAGEVDLRWLAGRTRIGITAGASAPAHLVDELVQCLTGLGSVTSRTTHVVDEDVQFTLPREVH